MATASVDRAGSRSPRAVQPPLVGGFTPRNHFYMSLNAEILADRISIDIDDAGFRPRQELADPRIDGMAYVPKRFRRLMYKSFADGFQEIVQAIGTLLKKKMLPTKDRILEEAMPDFILPGSNAFYNQKVRHFLDHGGNVMWALAAVVLDAENDEDRSDDNPNYPTLSFFHVPQHGDDDNWHLVRRQLGLVLSDLREDSDETSGGDETDPLEFTCRTGRVEGQAIARSRH